jgi:alcohol dehydrogenase class IV
MGTTNQTLVAARAEEDRTRLAYTSEIGGMNMTAAGLGIGHKVAAKLA